MSEPMTFEEFERLTAGSATGTGRVSQWVRFLKALKPHEPVMAREASTKDRLYAWRGSIRKSLKKDPLLADGTLRFAVRATRLDAAPDGSSWELWVCLIPPAAREVLPPSAPAETDTPKGTRRGPKPPGRSRAETLAALNADGGGEKDGD